VNDQSSHEQEKRMNSQSPASYRVHGRHITSTHEFRFR
jgi:hypothetical protein